MSESQTDSAVLRIFGEYLLSDRIQVALGFPDAVFPLISRNSAQDVERVFLEKDLSFLGRVCDILEVELRRAFETEPRDDWTKGLMVFYVERDELPFKILIHEALVRRVLWMKYLVLNQSPDNILEK